MPIDTKVLRTCLFQTRLPCVLFGLLIFHGINPLQAQNQKSGDVLLAEYFRIVTDQSSASSLAGIQSAQDWNAIKGDYRSQLQEMLGLSPWPQRTPLKTVVTGQIERDGFVVEKLYFESLPGLYVTGNLYRPREVKQPLPAVLYVCGHAKKVNGEISYGNKTAYQHHGIWFARNGYVCLVIDTIELGEIQGEHHGTYNKEMWWWQSRGYTPAGVEAWNGIRALDYLQSRAEVDPERIGVTGRSGGGAYTWFISALDERVKVAVPVAGITSLKNHVVDGCIEGHCDCMYQVNTFGWDFPQLAALIAPRPLLISNTDKDKIFPLDGVVDVYNKTRRIYELLGAVNHIGLCIAEGGHQDVQELQNDAFRWFNRFLKNDTSQISMTAEPMFDPAELTVFTTLPQDQRVTSAHDWFVPAGSVLRESKTREDFLHKMETARQSLLAQTIDVTQGQANGIVDPRLMKTLTSEKSKLRLRIFQFDAGHPYELSFYVLDHGEAESGAPVQLEVLDQPRWELRMSQLQQSFPALHVVKVSKHLEIPIEDFTGTLVFFAPRGIGPTAWTSDAKEQTHIRRRFALLGTTLERVQVEDVLRAVAAISSAVKAEPATFQVYGYKEAAGWALGAAFLRSGEAGTAFSKLKLTELPTSPMDRAQFLALGHLADLQDVIADVACHSEQVILQETRPEDLQFCKNAIQAASRLDIKNIVIE